MTGTVVSPAYPSAADLDATLDALENERPGAGFGVCTALDETEAFPDEICRRLDELQVHHLYVPEALGGRLRRVDVGLETMRLIARRDLTVAIAHGKTFLGAVATWVGGSEPVQRRLARHILDGDQVALALTERAHGSDLLAGELAATRTPGGYRLDGEKWLVNNATRAPLVCVLARTRPGGGPRGFSLLLVDKRKLRPGSYRCLPAEPTHGIRGADISGITFTAAALPSEALVGAEGDGVEIMLKSLQLTRTMCAALSLGAAEHALGLAVDFTRGHHQYGRPLTDLPEVRRTLTDAFTDLLAMEALSLVASRSVHSLTAELATLSAAVKFLVPTTTEGMVFSLGQLLGARAFLTDVLANGEFQKLERDHRIVAIFDGSTVVNLQGLVNELPALARGYRRRHVDVDGLTAAATLDADLPGFAPQRLRLTSRHGCSVLQHLPACVEELRQLGRADDVPARVVTLAGRLLAVADELTDRLGAARPSARDVPPESFWLAQRYTLCVAAACAVEMWLRNRDRVTGPLWQRGLWLEAVLLRIGTRLGVEAPEDGWQLHEELFAQLLSQHATGRGRFSLQPSGRPA